MSRKLLLPEEYRVESNKDRNPQLLHKLQLTKEQLHHNHITPNSLPASSCSYSLQGFSVLWACFFFPCFFFFLETYIIMCFLSFLIKISKEYLSMTEEGELRCSLFFNWNMHHAVTHSSRSRRRLMARHVERTATD